MRSSTQLSMSSEKTDHVRPLADLGRSSRFPQVTANSYMRRASCPKKYLFSTSTCKRKDGETFPAEGKVSKSSRSIKVIVEEREQPSFEPVPLFSSIDLPTLFLFDSRAVTVPPDAGMLGAGLFFRRIAAT